jgi:hypothetical protein
MGKQMTIGMYPPNAFRENEAIRLLYAEKRAYERQSILAQRQGDAWSVMEATEQILNIEAMILDLQKTAI